MNGLYAGLFIKLSSLNDMKEHSEQSSVILYWNAGRRFMLGRYFVDVRINQHILSLKWSDNPGSKPSMGFHPSIYKWSSPYVPFVGVGIGYVINKVHH